MLRHFLLLLPFFFLSIKAAFVHPGALHTANDFKRITGYVNAKTTPWYTDWELLLNSSYAQSTYKSQAVSAIYRGSDGVHAENYNLLYEDAAAMYQLALRWKISGDSTYGKAAVSLLNSWGSTLKVIGGDPNQWLATGLYGYQLANAAEIMRGYSGWASADFSTFQNMMENVFAAQNQYFLATHNGSANIPYANWDLCNMASMLAIGILNDNATKFDWVVNYFYNGWGHGAVGNSTNFIIANFTESGSSKILSQGQEAGRDQGHATLDFTLAGVLAQQAYNQGTDLFAAVGNAFLNGAEYVSKYNVGYDVPYTPYVSYEGDQTVISSASRGDARPGYELLYAHYNDLKGLNASWTGKYRDYVNSNITAGVEGGGGNYGPNSGGFDGLGFGTLLYRLKA
ncbi:Chondroitin AC/alginate lyase [Penicillium occitanis (nom. inval.)]|nr:hypothetical protein PENOC_026780 [Penicillium occitanis (nom. inval.)]PCH06411.1 Chondroitin AC/alginate lyase [Penicillium occitanis (nom. inval.)]